MIFKLRIIIAVKQSERKLKNILQVVKLNKPPAKKTTERYHLNKKNSLTNQLEVIAELLPRVARAQRSTMGKKIW